MKKEPEKIYQFLYTDCIYESGMETISLHKTKKGAYNSMRKFLVERYMEWYNERIIYGKNECTSATQKFGVNSHHTINEIELKD
jgi:hypothetical protein